MEQEGRRSRKINRDTKRLRLLQHVGGYHVTSTERDDAQTEQCDSVARSVADAWLPEFTQPSPLAASRAPRHVWPDLCNKSTNILHYVSNRAVGKVSNHNRKAMEDTYIHSPLKDLEVVDYADPFKTRVTTVDWHPKHTNHITIGGKHGDIVFYKIHQDRGCHLGEINRIEGTGPGGYISALKYDPHQDEKFYTSSLNGQVCLRSAETGSLLKTMLNTHTWDNWFTSLDVHKHEDLVVSGRSNGWVYLQSKQGELIWEKRLHKGKVSHAEFSPRDPALLCTASLDHTVRLWDIRMVDNLKPLDSFHLDKGINSAYFSLTDGCRLLITDQYDELRVYQGPIWHLERKIKHPHRFFQHLTPIKAYWHPIRDIVVCGRFPDCPQFPWLGTRRALDIMDAATGEYLCEITDVTHNKIPSLSKFNHTGDMLLTSMGFSIQLWSKPRSVDTLLSSEKERDELDALQSTSSGPTAGTWERVSDMMIERPWKGGNRRKGDDVDKLKKKARTESKKKMEKDGKDKKGRK